MAANEAVKTGSTVVVERENLQGLLDALQKKGYQVHGPVVRDGSVCYRQISSVSELPEGWTDEQSGGKYSLNKNDGGRFFDYTAGAQSWRRILFPPERKMWTAIRDAKSYAVGNGGEPAPRLALFGVRPCELSAIMVQDRVFMWDRCTDPLYSARRRNAFIVVVNCGRSGGTCFCASMGSGPRVKAGFDLSMTEISESGRHYFVVEIGTEIGAEVMSGVACTEAGGADQAAASRMVANAESTQTRRLDTAGIKELLFRNFEHPRWEEVAKRCLTCGNCTFACPTCFCTTVEDRTSLGGESAERHSIWDSCFTLGYTYMAGGFISRKSAASRYRQWMVHKLAAWQDQFGTLGCVGCGRCITWCPVGIDITEEAAAIRSGDGAQANKEQ